MSDKSTDLLYSADQIVVPPELPYLLKEYTKAVIRAQPSNILQFSQNYFQDLQRRRVAEGGSHLAIGKTLSVENLKKLSDKLSVNTTGISTAGELQEAAKDIGISIYDVEQGEVPSVFYYLEVITIATTIISKNLLETLRNLFLIVGTNNEIQAPVFTKLFTYIHNHDKQIPENIIEQVNHLILTKSNSAIKYSEISLLFE